MDSLLRRIYEDLRGVIGEYRTSDLEFLSVSNALVFIGIDLRMAQDGSIFVSQTGFISRLKQADAHEIVQNKKLAVSVEKLKTFYRRHLGNLIWCLQTRFDIGFDVTEFATSSPYILEDPMQILGVVKAINRIIATLKGRVVELNFGSFFGAKEEVAMKQLGSLRIFVFSDAGFGTLRGSRSVEAAIIVAGKEMSRDGSIICLGSPLDFYSRKIGRVVRSTIAAEAVASANAIEVGFRHHSILTEVATGRFADLRPNNEDTFPLCTPFRACVQDESERIIKSTHLESCDEQRLCSADCVFQPRVVQYHQEGNAELECLGHGTRIQGGRLYELSEINTPCMFETSSSNQVYLQPQLEHPNITEREAMTLIKVIALSDCANVYSAVSNWQPRSVDKLTNLSLCFIRDLAQQISYSFLDADYNIADTSTKHYGNRRLFYLLCESRRFVLSFAGRQKMKEEKLNTRS